MSVTTPTKVRMGWLPHKDRTKRINKSVDLILSGMPKFFIAKQGEGSQGKRCVLWDYTKAVNGGKHLPTAKQEVGDCVSQGAANAINYLACMEKVRLGDNESFHPAFQPYLYGISRVQIGRGRLGRSDGSVGSWAADGVRRFGVLAADSSGCPNYSGKVARAWGRKPGPPTKFVKLGKKNLILSTAQVTSYNEVRDALFNGYPVTVASMRGFKMQPREDKGKMWGKKDGQWAHQMCFIGMDDDSRRPGCYVINSWGPDAHGRPIDDAPPGGFWVDADVVHEMVKQDDSFAFSQFNGFPEQKLNFSGIG